MITVDVEKYDRALSNLVGADNVYFQGDDDEVLWSKQGKCPITPEQFNAIYDDEMVGEE